MASRESMFKIDIIVNDVICFMKYKQFFIRSDFADIFSVYLKNPKECDSILSRKQSRLIKTNNNKDRDSFKGRSSGETIFFNSTVESLQENMRICPMELILVTRQRTKIQTGSIQIPWKNNFFIFLDNIHRKGKPHQIVEKGEYSLYHDVTSKRVATVILEVKLSYIEDKTNQYNIPFYQRGYSDVSSKCSKFSKINYIKARERLITNPGLIKTTYHGRRLEKYSKLKSKKSSKSSKNAQPIAEKGDDSMKSKSKHNELKETISDTKGIMGHDNVVSNNYSVSHNDGSTIPNQVYCVGYCTVETDDKDPKHPTSAISSRESLKRGTSTDTSEKDSGKSVTRYKLKICDSECANKNDGVCTQSVCSLDLPEEARPIITVTKCKDVTCDNKKYRVLPTPVDSAIIIDLHSLKNPCCETGTDAGAVVEEVVIGSSVKGKMTIGEDPCYCACECCFGLVKKTRYCGICGGYEVKGEDLAGCLLNALPHPCPLYHKIIDRTKSRSQTTSTSGSVRGTAKDAKAVKPSKSRPVTPGPGPSHGSGPAHSPGPAHGPGPSHSPGPGPNIEKRSTVGKEMDKKVDSDKDSIIEKKHKKRKSDEKYKLKHGYQGIPPQIGHSQCALPCSGTVSSVPKRMGWLWTAEDVPGLKYRPNWKPGATNKRVVKLLKMAKNPGEAQAKKRKRKEASKRRKNDKRPLLIVHKKDGEYNITMETMKIYQKPRAINQYPYEDKPALTYTIGRTDEENAMRLKKKDREHRRLEREQREFIQSSFKNMCEEICLKAYQQALGILPGAEDPDCTCFPALPDPEKMGLDRSCSCSEDKISLDTETDSDEWVVEFTPPNALFDPKFIGKRIVKTDNGSQYTYLDYRIKLFDRQGNPVPRFFKDLDGKEQCSDLGGFWGPDKTWTEINVDGFIAPDGRWAPNIFIGPGGEVDAATGKFQSPSGVWYVVGVDGYVDSQGHWRWYGGKPRQSIAAKTKTKGVQQGSPKKQGAGGGGSGDKKENKVTAKPIMSTTSWSCFGDNISPKYLSEMGIVGHGHDKHALNKTLKEMITRGEKISIPQSTTVPRSPRRWRSGQIVKGNDSHSYFEERNKCHHALPSDKGILAVDDQGNKTYFKLTHSINKRPKDRINTLHDHGISVSSFHVPCLHSFINSEVMKKQLRDRLFAMAAARNAPGDV